ncbi:LPS-assembly protein LptD [Synechococcus sp. ATX 2A4]|nr:LPS-assembly protein LptD [Synechococcus sp. ATX 2A4]
MLALLSLQPSLARALPLGSQVPEAPALPRPAGRTPEAPAPRPAPEGTVLTPQTPDRATGLVTIESDTQRADNATGIVTATGNVRILYPDRRLAATARQAQYFTLEGRIVLTGDVDVVQEGGNLLRAERVVYLVDTERVLAQPSDGKQVFSQLRIQQNAQPAGPAAP